MAYNVVRGGKMDETNIVKEDIFDKMMKLPILRFFEPFYRKYKEVLIYLLFGFLTFVVSTLTFAVFNVKMDINELIATVLSWIIAVTFAFLTNRVWVFNAPTFGVLEYLKQMTSFFGGRVVTLIIEEVIIYIFVTTLKFDSMMIKIIAQVIVIILNYVISKLVVFKK